MKSLDGAIICLSCLFLSSCVPVKAFPPDVTTGADVDFDFNAWRVSPTAAVGRKVQLGGRIVQVTTTNEGFVIIAAHLPVVDHPMYGPKDTGKRAGEFAIFYTGAVPLKSQRVGNRLMVVGVTTQPQVVNVDDVQRSMPSLIGQCLHVWNTGGKEIADFPHNAGAGYEPLEEDTFCISPQ